MPDEMNAKNERTKGSVSYVECKQAFTFYGEFSQKQTKMESEVAGNVGTSAVEVQTTLLAAIINWN